jgi:glutamine amidotransferase
MIAVVDLGENNTFPLKSALSDLTHDFIITSNEIEIFRADKVILVGYGEASQGVKKLHLLNLFSVMRILKKPMLGIGLGMQLMCNYSTEGNVSCLGIFPGSTEKFAGPKSKIRHTGLDTINVLLDSKLFDGITKSDKFYFDHSFYTPKNNYTTSLSQYGILFSSSLEKEHSYGVQFHPEKSGEAGMKLLQNFIQLKN